MSTVTAPDRSLEQRREALKQANKVRSKRARLKRDLKAGKKHVADVLASPPEYIATMKVLNLLRAAPKIGQVKASNLMYRCEMSPTKTVGGVSDRKRGELVRLLSFGGPIGVLRTREMRPGGFCEEETAA